jgi:hypothetical protein
VVSVCCEISRTRIIRDIFLSALLALNVIVNCFCTLHWHLKEHRIACGFFQEGDVAERIAYVFMALLCSEFGERLISRTFDHRGRRFSVLLISQ